MADDPATELSARTVEAARGVRVLGSLSWPEDAVQTFLIGWRAKNPKLPVVDPPKVDADAAIAALDAVVLDADSVDPLQAYVAHTAASYATAGRMLQAAGTPAFTTLSRELYGAPDERLPGSSVTHRVAAEDLLENTDNLTAAGVILGVERKLSAEDVQIRLIEELGDFFGDQAPDVEVDLDLASKAAAGSRRIRIRGATRFSELDVAQLLEHEAYVHTATALNGRAQPIVGCMGLSAPRTTLTQEGLATLAELATRAIDIARLRRIALRTVAIHHALDGADFLDVFKFFQEAGQGEDESAHSAMRVFRGGDVRGRVCFTKDVVYLGGLFAVHTFLRKAIAESRPHLVRRLFAGRMALPDVLELAPAFAEGRLIEPRFVPKWAGDLHQLAAYLAFSALTNRIDLNAVDLETMLAS